jgi:hypothetical protein
MRVRTHSLSVRSRGGSRDVGDQGSKLVEIGSLIVVEMDRLLQEWRVRNREAVLLLFHPDE